MKKFLLSCLITGSILQITNAQNVGIGEASPSKKLEVKSAVGNDGLILDMPNPSLFFIDNTNANSAWAIYNQGTDDGLAFRSSDDDFTTNLNTRLFLEHATGNIGIGTAAPDDKLDIIGNTRVSGSLLIGDVYTNKTVGSIQIKRDGPDSGLTFWTESSGITTKRIWIDDATETLQLTHGAAPGLGLVIDNTGQVGIGNVAPAFTFDVTGTGRFTDDVSIPLTPTSDEHAASKKYVDDQIGAVTETDPTWSGTANTTASVGRTGNVGVGTASPSSVLHVSKTDGKAIFEDGASGQSYIELDFSNAGSPQIGMSDKNNDNYWAIGADDSDNALKFAGTTSGSIPVINGGVNIKMTLLPGGNVGIGTETPGSKLDVVGTGNFTGQVTIPVTPSADTDAASKKYVDDQIAGTGDNLGNHSATQDIMLNGNVLANGGSGANYDHLWYDDASAGGAPGVWHFVADASSKDNGNARVHAGHVYMQNAGEDNYFAGNVGVGTASPGSELDMSTGSIFFADADYEGIYFGEKYTDAAAHSGAWGYIRQSTGDGQLEIGSDADITFYETDGRTERANFDLNGGVFDFTGRIVSNGINETSDVRLKKNINTLNNSLEKVMQLRGVNYEWRTEEFPKKGLSERVELGVIAQEIEQIIPEVVNTDEEGYKSVQYSHIVPLLIEAIKEQQDIIASKDCELQVVKSDMNSLKAEVAQIKELLEMSAKK